MGCHGKTSPLLVYSREKPEGLPNWLLIRNVLFHQGFTYCQSFSSLGNEKLWMAAVDSSGSPAGLAACSLAGRGEQLSFFCAMVAPCELKMLCVGGQCAVIRVSCEKKLWILRSRCSGLLMFLAWCWGLVLTNIREVLDRIIESLRMEKMSKIN